MVTLWPKRIAPRRATWMMRGPGVNGYNPALPQQYFRFLCRNEYLSLVPIDGPGL